MMSIIHIAVLDINMCERSVYRDQHFVVNDFPPHGLRLIV